MNLFGFEFFTNKKQEEEELKSISRDENDGSLIVTTGDSSTYVVGDAWAHSTSVDMDPLIVSEAALITKYREIATLVPEVDKAIDIIINEIISTSAEKPVTINLDNLNYTENLKEKITAEWDYITRLLDFNNSCYEIIRRWYIDGRLQYQVVIDKNTFKEKGIGKLTYLDPRKIKKVRVSKRERDPRTGVDTYQEKKSYYIYSDSGFLGGVNTGLDTGLNVHGNVSIAEEAVVQITSGLLDPTQSVVLSYLHKAIRPLNQLKSLEDATMIYKISRAPERRIFYIDVGNLPPAKAEQVLQKQMNQYKSKMIYDVNTGSVKADPKVLTMVEDYWLPRRSDGRATEITTLPSGGNLGEMSELNYFLNKVYNSLNVPITRMDPSTGFAFGKMTEITRDEVMLTKFVARLRRRISMLFLDLLKRQLALKNILNEAEFEKIKDDIKFIYESDNHFDEMLQLDIFENRMNILDRMVAYLPGGQNPTIFSREYAMKDVLFFTEEEIELMDKQIEEERKKLKAELGDMDPDGDGTPGVFKGPVAKQVLHKSDRLAKASKNGSTTDDSINNTDTTNQTTQEEQ